MAGGVISRKMFIAIGTGVIKANCPSKLKEFGGHIALTESWARGVLKSMKWSKRKGATGKIEPIKQFLLEEELTFQRRIASIIGEHGIPKERILNLNQTPLPYVSRGKYTFNSKYSKRVHIKGIDDNRQITATFTVSVTGKFLPIQLIYEGKTPRCLPRFVFPAVLISPFLITIAEKSIELFEKVIFPYLKQAKASLKYPEYPEEQMPLIIMDTFKGQDGDVILDLCEKHMCEIVIISHNLTNKFQPLDITVNKPAKSVISNKYNEQFSKQVSQQLEKGIQPADVKVSLGFIELKVEHAKWILELYNHLRHQNEIVLNGFKAASITEVVESANTVLERMENPFSEQQIWATVYVLYLLYQEFDLKLFCFLVTENKMFVMNYKMYL